VSEVFPGLRLQYTSRFSSPPLRLQREAWHNPPDDIGHFTGHLKRVLPLKTSDYRVIIVQRGLDREKYPGPEFASRSGADRRNIGEDFDHLVERVRGKRPDAVSVTLESLPFPEQVSLFLNAKILIAQHGAAFAHAHWMPPGGHLIELQCQDWPLSPDYVPAIAKLRDHKTSTVLFSCESVEGRLIMRIDDATKVASLLDLPANLAEDRRRSAAFSTVARDQ
jgi:hypothetical protein